MFCPSRTSSSCMLVQWEFQVTPPQHDLSGIWKPMWQLLVAATLALYPLPMDTVGSASHIRVKLWLIMIKEAPANVQPVVLTAPLWTASPVVVTKAREALQAAPTVALVVTKPPLMPQIPKVLMTSASAKSSAAPPQSKSLRQSSKSKTTPSSSTSQLSSGQS